MVFLICADCGNVDEFEQIETRREYNEYRVYYDGNYDSFDDEFIERMEEAIDECEPLTCSICKNENVKEFETEEELNAFIKKHTTKDDEWSIEEVKNIVKKERKEW